MTKKKRDRDDDDDEDQDQGPHLAQILLDHLTKWAQAHRLGLLAGIAPYALTLIALWATGRTFHGGTLIWATLAHLTGITSILVINDARPIRANAQTTTPRRGEPTPEEDPT